jgi:hypothetical protein
LGFSFQPTTRIKTMTMRPPMTPPTIAPMGTFLEVETPGSWMVEPVSVLVAEGPEETPGPVLAAVPAPVP